MGRKRRRVGPRGTHIGQAEAGDDLVAVAQRRAEDLAGVDEDHRNGRRDRRGKMQEHDGIRTEA